MTFARLPGLGAIAGLLICGVCAADVDPAQLKEDGPIEVREGDTWSSATYVKREGRRFQVRYGDGTDEWVAGDRLRIAGDAASTPTTGEAKATAPRKTRFVVGDTAEVRDNFKWGPARVEKTASGWFLVQQTEFPSHYLWVEPWRLRVCGSAYDIEGRPHMIMPTDSSSPPPDGTPGQTTRNNGESRFGGTAVTVRDELPSVSAPMRHSAEALKLDAPTTQPSAKAFKTFPLQVDKFRKFNLTPCSDGSGFAMLWTSWPGRPTDVQVLDLAGRRSLSPSIALGGKSLMVIAATNQGRLLATTEVNDERITLWARQGATYRSTGVLIPFGNGLGSTIAQAAFVSPTRMVAVCTNGSVAAIDLQAGKITGRVKGKGGRAATLHASGKLMAFVEDHDIIQIVQTETWTIQATIRTQSFPSHMSFDPTGRYLAMEQFGKLTVYDTAMGAQMITAPTPVGMPGAMELLDERTLLYGGSQVVDIKTGLALWAWTGPSPVTTAMLPSGQTVLAAFGGNQAYIHQFTPLTETVQTLQKQIHGKTLPQPILDKLTLMPGMSVSLECNLEGIRGSAAEAEAGVRKNLQEAGFTIADGQPIRVVLSMRDAGSAHAMISAQGMPRINDGQATSADVTIHKRVLTVSVQSGDQVLWTYEVYRDDTSAVVSRAGQGTVQVQGNDGISAREVAAVRLPRYLAMRGGEDAPAAAVGQSRVIDDQITVTRDPMTPDAPPTTRPAKKIKPISPKPAITKTKAGLKA